MARFTSLEQQTIANARTDNPTASQRGLAQTLFNQSFAWGNALKGRTVAAIYGGIRTYDAKNNTGPNAKSVKKTRKARELQPTV